MPYRHQQFVNDEIYHITLRGIDNNLIFKDTDNYYRGIFSIYEFNTTKPVTIQYRRRIRIKIKKEIIKDPIPNNSNIIDERDKFVEVLSFCFMPNHIHLLIRQIKDDGISKFMHKIGTGYGRYFNIKYSRKGHVFQDRFSAVHIKDDNQLKIVFTYIHTNPISLIEPKWKEKGIKNSNKAIKFLESYKWSSYSDYLDEKNFPSVTDREFILEVMNGEKGCKKFIENWVKYKDEIKDFDKIILE